ncbi:uncharacterized protein DUF2501 [Sphingomonas sp. BK036]|uniref:DUF2501 domain-containing protein n=1 Tax=Sphingomonas sp. BK036 TaxID=2512122 RepID=UPI0010D7E3EC|nr:DUF2501 domain-containing protein [Sphingomonas sp. BK036]RZT47474.1 uncharacterized protein DUF2501 [Sphingomonas sp. BK036]
MKTAIALAAALSLTTGAAAQTAASQTAAPQTERGAQGGFGGLSSLGGLLGGGLPNVGSVGAGNAAGLLGYCLKNRLLGQGGMLGGLTGGQTGTQASGAQSILQQLTGRKDVQTSPGYAAGQAGQVQAGNGQTLSLGNLGGQVKTQLCNVVLKRAKAFL